MRTSRENCLTTNIRIGKDEPRSSRHKSYRDGPDRRQFSSSGRPRHPSRSRSPSRRGSARTSYRRSSPPPYSHSRSPLPSSSKQPLFQPGAGSKSPPVCALCLGREVHDVFKCQSNTCWDGTKARCCKNDQGRLVTPTGNILCYDWNTRRGCTANGHDDCHECSGCGNKDHGAQYCPRAQKKSSAHSL